MNKQLLEIKMIDSFEMLKKKIGFMGFEKGIGFTQNGHFLASL